MPGANGDIGAGMFTSIPNYFDKIEQDKLSNRQVTRQFYMETLYIDRYIKKQSKKEENALENIPRFYLMVDGDKMMDNNLMDEHISLNSANATSKYYSGGEDSMHFLTFTSDKEEAINDIDSFIQSN